MVVAVSEKKKLLMVLKKLMSLTHAQKKLTTL